MRPDKHWWPARGWAVPIVLGLLFLSAPAAAQEVWTVLPFGARGVDPDTAATFRDLLQLELSTEQPQAAFVSGYVACGDAACALDQAQAVGADVALFGSLNTLGQEIVVAATAVDVADGRTRSAQRMTVDRLEELDTVAQRMARAIARGTTIEQTAELGAITTMEAEPEIRRMGDSGVSLRLGGMVPLVDTLGASSAGIAIGLSYWYETRHFALEPHVGARFSTDRGDHSFFDLPIEIGAFWIPGLGDVAPFLGGGVGVHYINESRPSFIVTGTVIQTEMKTVFEDDGWGPGLFGRLGLMLLRTWSTRLAITADYNVVFMRLNDGRRGLGPANYPQSLTFGVSIIF